MNMKRTLLSTSIALAVAGFLGTGAAFAQYNAPAITPPAPAATPPAATPPAATSPATTPPAATPDASKSPTANLVVAPSKTESGPAAFAKLDTKHRGYVNSEDVSQLQGFNFKIADKNSDGKLDATEFNAAWALYSARPKS